MLYAAAAVILFGFWVLMSGQFSAFLLAAGAGSAIAVALFARRMAVIDREGYPLYLGLHVFTYWPWLVKEMAKSAWTVSLVILHPRLPISPVFVRVKPSQRTVIGRVTYANSITLTPGTITVDADADEFLVHALTREGARDLAGGDMDRRVSRFERAR